MKARCEIKMDVEWDTKDMGQPWLMMEVETMPLLTRKQASALVKEFKRLLHRESEIVIDFAKRDEPDEYAAWKRCPVCQGKPTKKKTKDLCGAHFERVS